MNRYVIAPDGRCVYPIELDYSRPDLPGEIKPRRHLGSNRYLAIVVTDGPVSEIPAVRVDSERDGRWILREDRVPAMFLDAMPKVLTDAEIEALDDDDTMRSYYGPNHVRIEIPDPIDVSDWLPFPVDEIIDEPVNNWSPGALGIALGPGLDRYAPGWLSGFRQAVVNMAKEIPGVVDVWEHMSPQHIECNVRSFYDPPRVAVEARKARGRRGAETPGRQTWQTTKVKIDTPAQIGGSTLAAALENWRVRMEEARASLEVVSTAKVCSHCEGAGYFVITGRTTA